MALGCLASSPLAVGDVGIRLGGGAGFGVLLTPVARVSEEGFGAGTGVDDRALQHRFQVLHIRWRIAHSHRHDHLMVSIDHRLEVVALKDLAIASHDVAVGVGEVPLGFGSGGGIGLVGQASPRPPPSRGSAPPWSSAFACPPPRRPGRQPQPRSPSPAVPWPPPPRSPSPAAPPPTASQKPFGLEHPLVVHGYVFGGIGFHLGAIKATRPRLTIPAL